MYRFKLQRLIAALVLGAFAQSCAAAGPSAEALVAREITVLELAGGGTPLTPTERRQAAEAVASALRGNPQALFRNYAALTQPLQRAAHDRAYAERLRKALRYTVEEGQPAPQGLERITAVERQIVRAHDPVVAFDPARKHLITEASLRDFRDASAWLAQQWNLPPPTPNFTAHLRDWFRTAYLKSDNITAQVLASQAESFPYMAAALAKADPKRKEAAIQQARQQLQSSDPVTRDQALAASVAVLGVLAERQMIPQGSAWDNNPLLSKESKEILNIMLPGGVVAGATVQGINNADIFANDVYRH